MLRWLRRCDLKDCAEVRELGMLELCTKLAALFADRGLHLAGEALTLVQKALAGVEGLLALGLAEAAPARCGVVLVGKGALLRAELAELGIASVELQLELIVFGLLLDDLGAATFQLRLCTFVLHLLPMHLPTQRATLALGLAGGGARSRVRCLLPLQGGVCIREQTLACASVLTELPYLLGEPSYLGMRLLQLLLRAPLLGCEPGVQFAQRALRKHTALLRAVLRGRELLAATT